MSAPTQSLHCANGDHPWTRPSRRGPRPTSCTDHPRDLDAVAALDAAVAEILDEAANVDTIAAEHLLEAVSPTAARILRLAYGFRDEASNGFRFAADLPRGARLLDVEISLALKLSPSKVGHLHRAALATMRAELVDSILEAYYVERFAEQHAEAAELRAQSRSDALLAERKIDAGDWLNPNGDAGLIAARPARPARTAPDAETLPDLDGTRKPRADDLLDVDSILQPNGGPAFGGRTAPGQPDPRDDVGDVALDYTAMTVPEGDRLGADNYSQEIRGLKGWSRTLHNGHRQGERRPLVCGDCFLGTVRAYTDQIPEHRAHRAS